MIEEQVFNMPIGEAFEAYYLDSTVPRNRPKQMGVSIWSFKPPGRGICRVLLSPLLFIGTFGYRALLDTVSCRSNNDCWTLRVAVPYLDSFFQGMRGSLLRIITKVPFEKFGNPIMDQVSTRLLNFIQLRLELAYLRPHLQAAYQ